MNGDRFSLAIEADKVHLAEKYNIQRFITKSSEHGYWVLDEEKFLKLSKPDRAKLLSMWGDR